MPDFFISYTSVDEQWAEWIGYVLEEDGHSVKLQRWDFRPGSNFVLEMQEAASNASRTILVLSPDYMKSQYAAPEWAVAFAGDPQGARRTLLPVMIRDCQPDGLLAPIVHIKIAGLEQEAARTELLRGIRPERAKPSSRPPFPGVHHSPPKPYPGSPRTEVAVSRDVYLPKVRREPSDVDKRRFLRVAFDAIRSHFERGLAEASRPSEGLESDFQHVTAVEFRAEIFIHGKSAAACRIWQGGMFSDNGISYAEGRHSFGSNSCNEVLSVAVDNGDVTLSAMMGSVAFGLGGENIDLKRMNGGQAADYLWRRFVSTLESRR